MKTRNCFWFAVCLNKPIIYQSSVGFWGHVGWLAVNLAPVLGSLVEIRIGIEAVDNRNIMHERGGSMSSVKGSYFSWICGSFWRKLLYGYSRSSWYLVKNSLKIKVQAVLHRNMLEPQLSGNERKCLLTNCQMVKHRKWRIGIPD